MGERLPLLAYKGESSIPEELRRDFFALSGLFYVADKHFEVFFGTAAAVRDEATTRLDEAEPAVELNLETLSAFLERRFPDREHSDRASVGELADELLQFGYTTLNEVDNIIAAQAEDFATEEAERPPFAEPGRRFADVGVVRVSLAHANPAYRDFLREIGEVEADEYADEENGEEENGENENGGGEVERPA